MARALEMDMKVASAALGSTQLRSAAYERDRWKAGIKRKRSRRRGASLQWSRDLSETDPPSCKPGRLGSVTWVRKVSAPKCGTTRRFRRVSCHRRWRCIFDEKHGRTQVSNEPLLVG